MNAQERAAMQQALEALETPIQEQTFMQKQNAITALRAALAESERDWSMLEATQESLREHMAEIHRLRAALAQQAEPVCKCDLRTRLVGDGCEVCNPELAAEFAQQAEPVQEPVAWNWMLDGRPYGQVYYGNPPDADIAERAATAGRTVRLLYTAPQPQRPPLTDEEIAEATAGVLGLPHEIKVELARAIERKVRGKE